MANLIPGGLNRCTHAIASLSFLLFMNGCSVIQTKEKIIKCQYYEQHMFSCYLCSVQFIIEKET